MTTCPHCGVTLPPVIDAFCPECRERLDEAPENQTQDGTPAIDRGQEDRAGWLRLLFTGVGAMSLLLGLFALARGDWIEALYTGGGGLLIALGGLWFFRPSNGTRKGTP